MLCLFALNKNKSKNEVEAPAEKATEAVEDLTDEAVDLTKEAARTTLLKK